MINELVSEWMNFINQIKIRLKNPLEDSQLQLGSDERFLHND